MLYVKRSDRQLTHDPDVTSAHRRFYWLVYILYNYGMQVRVVEIIGYALSSVGYDLK